jgi:hypothetical protein
MMWIEFKSAILSPTREAQLILAGERREKANDVTTRRGYKLQN